MKRIVLLGSTGSIGTQTLDIVRANPGEFEIIGLCAHSNTQLFQQQVREFRPKYVVQTGVSENPGLALASLASVGEADIVVNALAGSSGLLPTLAACKAGKVLAQANKESLVMAGQLIMEMAQKTGAQILPIDSEPSAIWQMLRHNEPQSGIEKIILTASGGPFWKWKREELMQVSAEQALKHPTWKMGEKVSIDSATLMNKAFEIIETRWLFDVPPEKIDVTVHRQSTVHALVQFCDGNFSAVLSAPDMKIPIAHALFYPQRKPNNFARVDFLQLQWTFEKPDYSLFEGPRLAYEVLAAGGIMPAVFCLADEMAVSQFLQGQISFLEIYDVIKRALDNVKNTECSLEALEEISKQWTL
ncbi:MAG: 1-deoxy-D-xylulose-5-phosphate reductoisomerase [Patescibacteria group bacterium]